MTYSALDIAKHFQLNPIKPLVLNTVKQRAVAAVFLPNGVEQSDIFNFMKFENQGDDNFYIEFLLEFETHLKAKPVFQDLEIHELIKAVFSAYERDLEFLKNALILQANEKIAA